jgi:LysM repeat protein
LAVRIRMGVVKAFVIVFLCAAIFGPTGYFGYRLFVAPGLAGKNDRMRAYSAPPSDPDIAEFARCMKLKAGGDLLAARDALNSFVEQNPNSPKIGEAKDALGETNTDIFFSTTPSPDKLQYVIQKGDTLSAIENKTRASAEFIMRTNNLEDPGRLRVGQVLSVPRSDFRVGISRVAHTVILLNNGKFFKQYRVKSWNAPAAKSPASVSTRVVEKIAWKNGRRVTFGTKEYAGSSRWIALGTAGYTLYTDAPETSAGKPPGGLGLSADEMEELSTLLNRNTPVTIQ